MRDWNGGEISGGKVGKGRGRWGQEVGKCGNCQCVCWGTRPSSILCLWRQSILCPCLCVRRNHLHFCPSLSVHTWSLTTSRPSALQPGCPDAGPPLAPALGVFLLGSLWPDWGLVYAALDPTKACPTLTLSAVPHRPLQSPHRPPELRNPGGADLCYNPELQAAAHLVHVNPQN